MALWVSLSGRWGLLVLRGLETRTEKGPLPDAGVPPAGSWQHFL